MASRQRYIRFAVANLHTVLPLTTMPERRFSPPLSIRDSGDYFVVRDSGGQPLAYVYYEEEPRRRPSTAKLLSKGAKNRCQVREAAGAAAWEKLINALSRTYSLSRRGRRSNSSSLK